MKPVGTSKNAVQTENHLHSIFIYSSIYSLNLELLAFHISVQSMNAILIVRILICRYISGGCINQLRDTVDNVSAASFETADL